MASSGKTDREAGEFRVSIEAEVSKSHPLAERLHANDPALDLFQTLAWFQNLSAHGLEPGTERLHLLVQQVGDGRCFDLPLLRQAGVPAAVSGTAVTAMSNFYSSLYGPAGDPSAFSAAGVRAALRALAARDGWPAVLDLRPLDAEASVISALEQALQAEGYWTDRYFCFGNWHLPVLGRSYASYEPSLPSRLRNTIKRGRKKLDAAGAWSLQVHQTPGPALESGIADFEVIYAKSWKVPEPFPNFVPSLCRMAATRGWLRLGVVYFEDKPIASQLWIVKDGRALIYKLAYDEAHKRFSAGSVLSAEMMRRALDEDRVDDVDYLTGDDGYKRDWMSHRRERLGLVAFRRASVVGGLSWAKHGLGKLRSRWQARRTAAVQGKGAEASGTDHDQDRE